MFQRKGTNEELLGERWIIVSYDLTQKGDWHYEDCNYRGGEGIVSNNREFQGSDWGVVHTLAGSSTFQSDIFQKADIGRKLIPTFRVQCLSTDARPRRSSVHKLTALPFIKLSHKMQIRSECCFPSK